jgi:predicted O-methyltransferase YrrM
MNDLAGLREPASLAAIAEGTERLNFPMASEPLTGALLRTLAAAKPAGRILELGSGTGLSTAWVLDGMDKDSELLTIDFDDAALGVLRGALGTDSRLTVVSGDADVFVHSLAGQRFDLIFADTWAGKYRLLAETLALLAPGGIYVIDDMLPQPNWPSGHDEAAAHLLAALGNNDDLVVSRLSWASGIVVATKRAE